MLLSAQDVNKSFSTSEGDVVVLNDASLSLDRGETLALTGESGSGKSTFLHLIAGLDRPSSGKISLNGQDLSQAKDRDLARMRREEIGLIFQQFNLIPSLTLAQNLAFQARLAGKQDEAWLDHLADTLGLSDLLGRYPEQLSGGQQQRVAIGRALAAKPGLILADEPTGNLDEENAQRVMELLLALVADSGAALLLVTHSTDLAKRLSRRLHLSHGRLAA